MGQEDRNKLIMMLQYWIEHNKEHSDEFASWAETARALGEEAASREMLAAAGEVGSANQSLSRALKLLAAK